MKESGAVITGMNTVKALLAQCGAGQPSASCDTDAVIRGILELADEITAAIAASPYPAGYTNLTVTIEPLKFSASAFQPGGTCREWLSGSHTADKAVDFLCRPKWDTVIDSWADLEWFMTWS